MIARLTLPSPFHRLEQLSTAWKIDLWAKRDDLIPQYMGGNKVRKNFGILQEEINSSGVPDVLITNGGAESNHARVVALMGAQLGCKVNLVLHGKKPSENNTSGNSFFYRSAGAVTHYVSSQDIGSTIDALASKAQEENLSALVIPGGGHSIDGVHEYAKALDELPFEPDYIVHASGTGGTQAGLLKGVASKGWRTKVIGISVARAAERGISEIAKLLPANFPKEKIIFRDEYRFGGYEKTADELLHFIKNVVKSEGIPLDFTYTGKAMFGLHELIVSEEIQPESKVVFWHTGGLLNLTSMHS